jgi:hypothetical protein
MPHSANQAWMDVDLLAYPDRGLLREHRARSKDSKVILMARTLPKLASEAAKWQIYRLSGV